MVPLLVSVPMVPLFTSTPVLPPDMEPVPVLPREPMLPPMVTLIPAMVVPEMVPLLVSAPTMVPDGTMTPVLPPDMAPMLVMLRLPAEMVQGPVVPEVMVVLLTVHPAHAGSGAPATSSRVGATRLSASAETPASNSWRNDIGRDSTSIPYRQRLFLEAIGRIDDHHVDDASR